MNLVKRFFLAIGDFFWGDSPELAFGVAVSVFGSWLIFNSHQIWASRLVIPVVISVTLFGSILLTFKKSKKRKQKEL